MKVQEIIIQPNCELGVFVAILSSRRGDGSWATDVVRLPKGSELQTIQEMEKDHGIKAVWKAHDTSLS
jgi:hypothetical protein